MDSNQIKVNFLQKPTSTGVFGSSVYDISTESKIRFVVSGADSSNSIQVKGRIKLQTGWTLVKTLTGSASVVVDIETYDEMQLEVMTYSPSGELVVICSSFDVFGGGDFSAADFAGNVHQIFIDPSVGDDNNTGSVISPLKTIHKAVTLVVNPADQYLFMLAPGNYTGAPLTIPGNISMSGMLANVQFDISLGLTAGDQVTPVYSNVGFNNFVMDLSPAAIALPIFFNGGISITRLDAVTGPHAVQVHGGTIGNINLIGNALVNDVLFVGSATVQPSGGLLLNSCVVGINITVSGTGSISMTGCTFSGSITGTPVGPNTPVVRLDASSKAYGGTVTGCDVVYIDDAKYVAFTPTTPLNWVTVPTTTQEALDYLAATTSTTKYSSNFFQINWSLNTDYEITVSAITHGKGTEPTVEVYEANGFNYDLVSIFTEIDPSGNVKIVVPSSPDLRFNGKLTIE